MIGRFEFIGRERKMFRLNTLKCKSGSNGIVKNLFVAQSTVAAKQASSPKSTTEESQRIVIPKKINRGPTDLLYTLSKTVGRDPTAVHYKYHDDPYLIPTSLYTREQYALSQEAGKQAAQWIRVEHAKLFNVSVVPNYWIKFSVPEVEVYLTNIFISIQGKRCSAKNRSVHPKNSLHGRK